MSHPDDTEAEGSPTLWRHRRAMVSAVLATYFPDGATMLTFGGIASFVTLPVF